MALKKRVVVVGLGSIGRRHARLLKERDDLSVELCEANEKVLQDVVRQCGDLPVYRSYEQMLATHPDIVVIATPHGLHASQTIQALQAKAHVLCEKPMSDKLDDALKMKQAADASGRVLNIGFQLHFHPAIKRIKELINEGALGTLLQVHFWVGSYVTLLNSVSRHQAHLEGALLFDYAHQPDLLYWLLGKKPTSIYMTGGQGGAMKLTSNPNFVVVTCDYDSPLISTIQLNYIQHPERHEYEFVGDQAWLTCNLIKGVLGLGLGNDGSEIQENVPTERDAVYRAEHQAFLDAIEGKRKPESPAEDALFSMKLITAAIRSWRERKRITLDWG